VAVVRALAGRRRPATVWQRRLAVRKALVASGVAPAPVLPTYDLTRGSAVERYFYDMALATGMDVWDHDHWPTEAVLVADPDQVIRQGNAAVYRLPTGGLVYVDVGHGWAHVSVASQDEAEVAATLGAFRQQYPPSYTVSGPDGRVPVTFWTDGRFGPVSRLRRIDASPWEPIGGNYTAVVRDELATLMGWGSGPERDGQLLVWLGPPGTGKTWALRALVSEWSPWAEFHYITDPDAFFVDNPSYMVDVLLADSYEAIDPGSGDIVTEADPEGKWRILILEDTGELLSAGAKEKYGQGLSRLLNVVDGMIGQGLRVLALVTTNDQLDDFHPAVTRPGRCASLVSFGPLTDEEAKAWTGNPNAQAGTLAELYAARGDAQEAFSGASEDETLDASGGVCGPATPLYGGEELQVDDDVVGAIKKVAADLDEKFGLDAGYGCGQTAWNPNTSTVLWVCGDGTSGDEVDEAESAFTGIDGVDNFEYEAEAMPEGWCDADVVYGGNPFDCEGAEEARMSDIVALASRPLDVPFDLG
jgi:hypothetical protein